MYSHTVATLGTEKKEQHNRGFCVHRSSVVDQLAVVESLFWVVWDALYWPLLLWGGGRFKELKIRMNVWSVLQDENKWSLQRI